MGMKHKVRKHTRRQNQSVTPRKGQAPRSVTTADVNTFSQMEAFLEGPNDSTTDEGMVLTPLEPGQGTDDDEVLGDIDSASRLDTEYHPEGE